MTVIYVVWVKKREDKGACPMGLGDNSFLLLASYINADEH